MNSAAISPNELGQARRTTDSGTTDRRNPASPAPIGWPLLFSFSDESPVRTKNKALVGRKQSANSAIIHGGDNPHISVRLAIPDELNFKLVAGAAWRDNIGRVNTVLGSQRGQLCVRA